MSEPTGDKYSKYEELPTLPEDADLPPVRTGEEELPQGESDTLDFDNPFPTPKASINQWRLLKFISMKGSRGLALSDMRHLWSLPDTTDDRLQYPLGQLIRAGRIKAMLGSSERTGGIGTVYISTKAASRSDGGDGDNPKPEGRGQ
jgi:hypothetical protein